MQIRGVLSINGHSKESRVDGTLLAIPNSASPLSDATAYLENTGFTNGQRAVINGHRGQLGDVGVIFIVSAGNDPTEPI